MLEIIQQSEATAARRRLYFSLIDETTHTAGEDISITGVKVMLSTNGAAGVASTNDIVKIDSGDLPGEYYLELTAAEVGTVGQIVGYLKPTGCDPQTVQATVVSYDPYAIGLTAAVIAAAVLSAASTTPIAADIKAVNAIDVGGAGTLSAPFGPA